MTMELVTGHAGKVHVTAAQQGRRNAYTWGSGSYVLDGCEVTVVDDNTVHVGEGTLLLQGRHVDVNGGGDDITIETGTVGKYRRDMVCARYELDVLTGVETMSFEVVKGTAGDAYETPVLDSKSILDGDSPVQIGLFTVDVGSDLKIAATARVASGFTTYDAGVPEFAEMRDAAVAEGEESLAAWTEARNAEAEASLDSYADTCLARARQAASDAEASAANAQKAAAAAKSDSKQAIDGINAAVNGWLYIDGEGYICQN